MKYEVTPPQALYGYNETEGSRAAQMQFSVPLLEFIHIVTSKIQV